MGGEPWKWTKKCLDACKIQTSTFDKICCFFSEFFATSILIFVGCIGCIWTEIFPNNLLQLNLNFGTAIMIAIQCFGCISGAHINPAITLAALVDDMITVEMAIIYVIGQLLGALVGYGLIKLVVPHSAVHPYGPAHGLCVTTVHPLLSLWQGLLVEFLITSILILVCCAVWDKRNANNTDSISIRFGLTIFSLCSACGGFTGASMNPARSFAPSVWHLDFTHHWIYWVGPLTAALITSFGYKAIFRREEGGGEKSGEPAAS